MISLSGMFLLIPLPKFFGFLAFLKFKNWEDSSMIYKVKKMLKRMSAVNRFKETGIF